MSSRPLSELGLDSQVLAVLLEKQLLTPKDVLSLSIVDVMETLNFTYSDAQSLIMYISQCVAPPYMTAQQLYEDSKATFSNLLTRLPGLDSALRKGIPSGSITEVVGPAGVGKSQFSYSLTACCLCPADLGGLGGAVVYMDTEGKFSSQRLGEVVSARFPSIASSPQQLTALLSRVLVMKPTSTEDVLRHVYGLAQAISQHGVKLIILDSIAALARIDYAGREQVIERQELLGRIAAQLKQLAETHRIPVIVINQVTARMTSGGVAGHAFQGAGPGARSDGGQGYLTAALGTKWAHAVNVRLVLERHGDQRIIKIAKSPASANVTIVYHITTAGVEQADETVYLSEQQSVLEQAITNQAPYQENEPVDGY